MGNGTEGAVEVVDGFDKVFGKFGDGEIFGRLNVAFCTILEIAELGDGAEVFVLRGRRLVHGRSFLKRGVRWRAHF